MTNIQEDVAMLRRIPLFAQIDPAKLKLIAFTAERIPYTPGQELFRQGDDAEAAYVILNGTAEVLVNTPDGELKVAMVEKNELVGEIAILCDTPRTATIRATTQLEVLRLVNDQFFTMIKEFPDLAIEMMRVLATRLTTTTEELTDARNKLAEGS
jgi:CRP-like cAMP-binding protein